jgi:IclR family pca regulon transcriptional regulator
VTRNTPDDESPPEISEPEDTIDPRYVVPGLSRGLALLQLFTRDHPHLSLAELSAGLNVTRSAAYRLVYTLEKDGFIARQPDTRQFRVTTKILRLGFEYLASQGILDIAQPYLRELSTETRASTYVVVLDGVYSSYIARVAPPVSVVSNLQIGSVRPAHLTASGRVLLAGLSDPELRELVRRAQKELSAEKPPVFEAMRRQAAEDRTTGYVFHPSLLDPGIASCAAPVRDHHGNVVAAITVVGPDHIVAQMGGEAVLSRLLLDSTAEISAKLGYRSAHPR